MPHRAGGLTASTPHFMILPITRNTCMQQPFAFISKHCFNMKYSERTQAHFARVM